MAQDFERSIARNIGTSASTLRTANSDDAVVEINLANVTTSQILVDVYITVSSRLLYCEDAPIPTGSSLQVLDEVGQRLFYNQAMLLKL